MLRRLIRSWGAGHREYDNPELAGLCDVATAEFLEEVSGKSHCFLVRKHPLYPTEGFEWWWHEIAQVGKYFVDWTPRQFDSQAPWPLVWSGGLYTPERIYSIHVPRNPKFQEIS